MPLTASLTPNTTFTKSADLSEADFVNVVFGVNEAVSGNYAPAIEQYAGHILVFSKVDTAITIPTISVTKIAL